MPAATTPAASISKGDQTRQVILDAALARASRLGVEALTIGSLASEVGLSKSGLFAHFDSKENLQLQVIEESRRRFIDAVIAPSLRAPRGVPRIEALFESWLAWARSPVIPGGCILIQTAAELDAVPGPARDAVVAAWRDWQGVLVGAARIAVQEGHFRPDLDLEAFAFRFTSVILAFQQYDRLLGDPRASDLSRLAFQEMVTDARAR